MRAQVARRLRRIAYEGRGHHPGPVGYHVGNRRAAPQMPKSLVGCIIADFKRREYQNLKKAYRKKLFAI
jgi:hypothetical protein